MNLTECTRCGALAATVAPGRPDFWNAPKGVCDTCRDRDRTPQGEAVRLFTPAPVQLPGQTTFEDVVAECVCCERIAPGAPGAGGAAHLCNECGGVPA